MAPFIRKIFTDETDLFNDQPQDRRGKKRFNAKTKKQSRASH